MSLTMYQTPPLKRDWQYSAVFMVGISDYWKRQITHWLHMHATSVYVYIISMVFTTWVCFLLYMLMIINGLQSYMLIMMKPKGSDKIARNVISGAAWGVVGTSPVWTEWIHHYYGCFLSYGEWLQAQPNGKIVYALVNFNLSVPACLKSM